MPPPVATFPPPSARPARPRRAGLPALRGLAFAPLAFILAAALSAPALGEGAGGGAGERTDPAAIDAAVAAFTGAAPGAPGGALAPADRRLRLAPCTAPLAAGWHGTARSMVRVECPDPGGWRVFVALRGGPAPAGLGARRAGAGTAPAAPSVERGDPVTVMIRGRGFTIQQAGEAMEPGREGEWIGIRLPSAARPGAPGGRAEPVRARILRPGLAVIPLGARRESVAALAATE